MVRPRTHRCRRRGRFFRGVSRVGPAGCAGVNQPVVVLAGFFVLSVVSAWGLGAPAPAHPIRVLPLSDLPHRLGGWRMFGAADPVARRFAALF